MIDIAKARQMLDWAEGDPQSDSAFIGRSWIFGHVAQMLDEIEAIEKGMMPPILPWPDDDGDDEDE